MRADARQRWRSSKDPFAAAGGIEGVRFVVLDLPGWPFQCMTKPFRGESFPAAQALPAEVAAMAVKPSPPGKLGLFTHRQARSFQCRIRGRKFGGWACAAE